MKELIINENNKIIISKKTWKNKDRVEICKWFKKNNKWIPTRNFINIDFNNAKKILKIVSEVING